MSSPPPWTNNTTYTPYDEVSYIGETYYCIVQNIGIPPTNATYWTATGGGGGGGGFSNINGLGPPTLTIKSANNATLTVATDLPTSSISLNAIPSQTGVQSISAGKGTTVNNGQPQQPSVDLNLTAGSGISLTIPSGTSGAVTIANTGILSLAKTTAVGSGISIAGTSANPTISTSLVAGDGIILTPSTGSDSITIASPPPAGSSGQLIYNNAGTYAGTAGVTYSGGILSLASNLNFANGQVKVGTNAGLTSQSGNAVAVGYSAGNTTQGTSAVAVGYNAGQSGQKDNAVAIGPSAGNTTQGSDSVAIGLYSGYTSQGDDCVAIGSYAAQINQAGVAVAVGTFAGYSGQATRAVAVGYSAGKTNQATISVAVGGSAGMTNQGQYAVAVGSSAGNASQGEAAIAIGENAGASNQLTNAIAIGINAGGAGQATNAIAIGPSAGNTSQGANAIAIGQNAGLGAANPQPANTIIINATGGEVSGVASQINSLYITPIRNDTTTSGLQTLQYNTTTKEVVYRSIGGNGPVLLEAVNQGNALTFQLLATSAAAQQIFQTSAYNIPFDGRVVMTVTGVYVIHAASTSGCNLVLQINDQNASLNAITASVTMGSNVYTLFLPVTQTVVGGRIYTAGTSVQYTFKGTIGNASSSTNNGVDCIGLGYTMILYPS